MEVFTEVKYLKVWALQKNTMNLEITLHFSSSECLCI